jgi:hypothetical protein
MNDYGELNLVEIWWIQLMDEIGNNGKLKGI